MVFVDPEGSSPTKPALDTDMLVKQAVRATLLRDTVARFCEHFAAGAPPSTILDSCFCPATAAITEHGPSWARPYLPYLAMTFRGRSDDGSPTPGRGSCDDYFHALAATLAFHPTPTSIPPPEHFVVDPGNAKGGHGGCVTVKAQCAISSVATGSTWEEQFIFLFRDFSRDGLVGHLEIWADSLSSWAAVSGGAPATGASQRKTPQV